MASGDFSAYKNLPVLVTGGAGFIGSHLVRGLLEAQAKVAVLDNFSAGFRSNLQEILPAITLIEGDITNPSDCNHAAADRAIVFHLAALGSVPGSVDAPVKYNQVNITGTLNMLQAARQAGARRFVYSASSAAYGDSPTLPKIETMLPAPKSPYAVGKLTGEYYARVYSQVYGLSTISLRYFNVFGPRQNPKSQYAAVIPAFITAILRNDPPTIYGDGEQTRDFCHVANVVRANMLAGIATRNLAGEVANIACGENISLNAMLEKMEGLLQKKVQRHYLPARPGDVRDSLADITLAHTLLGYEPAVWFPQGLEQTVRWFASQAVQRISN